MDWPCPGTGGRLVGRMMVGPVCNGLMIVGCATGVLTTGVGACWGCLTTGFAGAGMAAGAGFVTTGAEVEATGAGFAGATGTSCFSCGAGFGWRTTTTFFFLMTTLRFSTGVFSSGLASGSAATCGAPVLTTCLIKITWLCFSSVLCSSILSSTLSVKLPQKKDRYRSAGIPSCPG